MQLGGKQEAFNPFMYNNKKMVKQTLKILSREHHQMFKVCLAIFNFVHERVNYKAQPMRNNHFEDVEKHDFNDHFQ